MDMIPVTKPFLPPVEEYNKLLQGVWKRNFLTNQGPLVCELEKRLQDYHRIATPIHCVANGGLGLQIILKALGVTGEVITTPFSYIATASCPLWEGCRPVFADIDPGSLTIDPAAVEAAITPATEAILATHVFGNPCDVVVLQELASKHGVALIYDAAHAFGVRYLGKSILDYGDASMVSTHATKIFHTVEGGFTVAKDRQVAERIEWMRRFGHDGAERFHGVGINAKMSEFHAAMGLAVIEHMQEISSDRKQTVETYQDILAEHSTIRPGITLRRGADWNYSYFPVIFSDESSLTSTIQMLAGHNIHIRRYFYPSLDTLSCLGGIRQCPVSRDIASRIACLPLYACMDGESLERIAVNLQP